MRATLQHLLLDPVLEIADRFGADTKLEQMKRHGAQPSPAQATRTSTCGVSPQRATVCRDGGELPVDNDCAASGRPRADDAPFDQGSFSCADLQARPSSSPARRAGSATPSPSGWWPRAPGCMIHGRDQDDVDAACAKLGASAAGATGDLARSGDGAGARRCDGRRPSAGSTGWSPMPGSIRAASSARRRPISSTTIFAVNTRAPLLGAEAAIRAFRLQKSPRRDRHDRLDQRALRPVRPDRLFDVEGRADDDDAQPRRCAGPERIRVNCLNVGWTFTANEDATQQKEGRKPGWQNEVSPLFAPTGQIMQPRGDRRPHRLLAVGRQRPGLRADLRGRAISADRPQPDGRKLSCTAILRCVAESAPGRGSSPTPRAPPPSRPRPPARPARPRLR